MRCVTDETSENMERYLRFFIKFHGYVIAIWGILGALFLTVLIYQANDFHYPLEEFYDYRFMGSSAIVFGAIWLAVSVSMFYGVLKESKVCLYPFAVMIMLDIFLLFLRDIVLIWNDEPWYKRTFMNPIGLILALYVTLHVMLTMVAMGKLFEHKPLPSAGPYFVQLNNESPSNGSTHAEEIDDGISLVRE